MFHLAAYTGLIGQTVDTDIAALTDDILYIQNSHFFPTSNVQLLAAYLSSATLLRGKLNSPKLRQISPAYIRPINANLLPGSNPSFMPLMDAPFNINGQEELQLLATSNLGMGTERLYGLIWMTDQHEPAPLGDVYKLRWTSTTAATQNVWTTIAPTYEQQLPFGIYAVIDSEHFSTNAIAHRHIYDYQMWRPGWLSQAANSGRSPYPIQRFGLGKWGTFRTVSMPRFQVLCNGADNSHEGYISVVRIG